MSDPIRLSLPVLRPLLAGLLLAAALPASAGDASRSLTLEAFTEEWPPYNYSEQGQLKGIASDVLRASCKEAAIDCRLASVPWARAYQTALRQPNTLVYTTARRPDREHDFVWIGPLLSRSTWIYGLAAKHPQALERQAIGGLRFAVVRGEAAAQDLLTAGVPAAALVPEASNASVWRMLMAGHVDAVVDTEVGMAWNLRLLGADAARVRALMPLSGEGAYYFALNKQSDPLIAERLQAALDKLRRSGALDEIKRRYLGGS